MLHLIHSNKFGKNVKLSEEQINWRLLFKGSEDSLTSSVFGLLFYLPVELLWEILYNACYYPHLPKQPGKILGKDIWPRWNCNGTENKNFIEPDVFIRFENFDLIIEAKRYDDIQQQYRQQWINQITAYNNEYGQNTKRPLYFIAIGGFPRGCEKQEPIGEVMVTTCRWNQILHQVHMRLERTKNLDDSILFILQDLILSFRVHGFLTVQFLNTLPNIKISIETLNKISNTDRLNGLSIFPKT